MAMIEILVSALLLVIVALGVFTAFDAGTRASAQERHRARAHALAEADVARMQAMRIGNLAGLDQTRSVTHDGLTYSIRSQAIFVDEPATTSTWGRKRSRTCRSSACTLARAGARPGGTSVASCRS